MDSIVQLQIKLLKVQFPDFSFNSMELNTPNGFTMDMNLDYHIHFSEEQKDIFAVEFLLNIFDTTQKMKGFFRMFATFQTPNLIDADFKSNNLVNLNAPAIAFPFLRSFVTTISANAGYPPIILPAINLQNLKK